MTNTPTESNRLLRQRAEEKARMDDAAILQALSPEETCTLLHELRVHQIQLEMQNEELRKTQQELEASRAGYFSLYDLAPVGYLTFGDKGLIRQANLTAATMFGLKRNDLLGKPMSQFILSDDQDIYFQHRKQFIETSEIQSWEMRLLKAGGSCSWFWAHLQAAPAGSDEYRITFSDITEYKRAEEEKTALERKLQHAQKLESLGVLSGGIAHDFNNILGIIIGHCSMAKMIPGKTDEHLKEIKNAAERAAELCHLMLAYAGKTKFDQAQINMWMLVNDMVNLLRSTIKQNVTIKSDLPFDIPFIKADAGQIKQIVMNLIINASESIGESQGEIGVSLAKTEIREEQQHKDHFGADIKPGWYVCLEVTDNGCGMNDETKNRIFEPFYTTKFTGRGLGMSAVLGIITAHKGALQLYSQLGKGTTFRVYLPFQPADRSRDESFQQDSSAPWHGSGTILLVEDEEQIRFIAKTMLKELGFKIIEASNGKEAIELYLQNSADISLVVTDMGMPVMDGYYLFRELKKLNHEIPIIISSGFGDEDITSQINQDDIAGLINKPFTFEQLKDVLKGVALKRHLISNQG